MSERTKKLARQKEQAASRKAKKAEEARNARLAASSHRKRLAHAKKHIQVVKQLARKWAKSGAYEFAWESQKGGGLRLVGRQLKPVPDDIGLVIGDAFHAMRSSLDNLAFSLAESHTPNMSDKAQQAVSFPIGDVAPKTSDARLASMAPLSRSAVVSHCPDPKRGAVAADRLWQLNKMNNRDKHRSVTVAATSMANTSMAIGEMTVNGPAQIGIGGPKVTRKPGDEVLFTTLGKGSVVKNTSISGTLHLYDDGVELSGADIVDALEKIHSHIENVVFPDLESHLP